MPVFSARLTAAVGAVVLTAALTSCGGDGSGSGTESFTYTLNKPLVTTNAASALGVVTDAAKISARLYPGAFLSGPGNRLLPNSDLVAVNPAPDDPQAVDYLITDTATYSDGAPVVCDDFLLTWLAADRADLFSSDLGLMTRVRDITCGAGQKAFRVHFEDNMASRYRELFGAGEVLPAHTVAQRAGVGNVVDVVDSGDKAALTALGEAWNTTFNLGLTDPSTIPTYGPFRIESREEDGSLLFSTNPEWKGDPPGLDRLLIRGGADLRLAADRSADVSDGLVALGQPTDEDLKNAKFTLSRDPGNRIDGLTLSTGGVFATVDARRAFASCVDRAAIAAEVKKEIGAVVEPAPFRIATPGTPTAEALEDIAVRNNVHDPQFAASTLGGATVRIGFLSDQPRYTAIVEALTASCRDSGVTVVGVPLNTASLENPSPLGTEYDALLDTRTAYARNPEVAVSPVSSGVTVTKVRAAENVLADMVRTIPLSVEPRLIAVASSADGVSDSGTDAGLSWNMDRWSSSAHPSTVDPNTKDSN